MNNNNNKVPAVNFLGTVMDNLDNEKLSDSEFREFIRRTLPIVEKPNIDSIANKEILEKVKKYYKE